MAVNIISPDTLRAIYLAGVWTKKLRTFVTKDRNFARLEH